MNPLQSVTLTYHIPGERARYELFLGSDRVARPVSFAREIGFYVQAEKDEWHIHVVPTKWIVIDKLTMVLKMPQKGAKAIFMNGYQSDTDCYEQPLLGKTQALPFYPRSLINATAADVIGDYRFVKQDSLAGHQHGFTYGYVRRGSQVTLFGSLDENDGLTLIRQNASKELLTFEKEPSAAALEPGVDYDILSLCVLSGTLENVTRRWLGRYVTRPLKARPTIGYSTSYDGVTHPTKASEQTRLADVSETGVKKSLNSFTELLSGLPLHLRGIDKIFQLGEGYCTVGDWLTPNLEQFPSGIENIAQTIRAKGLRPALWLAPFVAQKDSLVLRDHPDWVLTNIEGKPQKVSANNGGLYALDVCNKEVQAYINMVVHTAVHSWGFEYLKIDYTYAAALIDHGGHNRAQLTCTALDTIRKAAGEKCFISLGATPLSCAIGRANFCEISCGASNDWDGRMFGRLNTHERKSTKHAVRTITARNSLNKHAFGVDPGVLVFNDASVLKETRYNQVVDAFTRNTQALIVAGNIGTWTEEQKKAYSRAIKQFAAHHGIVK
ncbi:alpha-galactosidase [Atopobium fossor]|uniref:alpha-galactosidase n=1 Tax=Atopobium fossor TaxID=39487 RepID=UPI0004251A17|nr:alpha-galactosidase [Atopobium fossor]